MRIDESATVLITGATGFLGRALVSALANRGCNIRLLCRNADIAQEFTESHNADIFVADLASAQDLSQACTGTSHIFNLAAAPQYDPSTLIKQRGRANSRTTIDAINIEGTRRLAASAAALPHPPRFIQVSTAAVHGDTGAAPATESSPFNATTDYERSKLEAELWLQDFGKRSGLPLTVLRPCAIVGPGDKRLLKLFRLANRRLVPIVGTGDNKYQIIHVDDMVRILLAAAEHSGTEGQTYVCGNPETLRLRELIQLIGAANGRREVRIICIPHTPVGIAVSALQHLCKALGVNPPVDTDRLRFFLTNHWFDTNKLIEGIERPAGEKLITHTNASAVADAQRWYENQRLL